MNIKLIITCFFSVAAGLTACVSAPHSELPQSWINSVARKMQSLCQLKTRSGFSADIILNNVVSSRVEAVWDDVGRLSGQLINPLGEDFVSFQIDEFGQFKTNQEIDESESLFQALELLARMGSLQTRYLLCSGLFISSEDTTTNPSADFSALKERTLATTETSLHLLSSVSRGTTNPSQVLVNSKVSTDSWWFKRAVAEIHWHGKLEREALLPTAVTVSSDVASIRLSFHDFD